jgi:hypothetical protein
MPVRYNGPNGIEELIPAPLVEIDKTFVKDEGGNLLRTDYTFTLNGTIVNVGTEKDSPDADNNGMEGILAEQERIRKLFSKQGGRLEIEAPDGGGPSTIDAYCTVESLHFNPGVWVNKSEYVIVLKSSKIEVDTTEGAGLSARSENWSVTENEDGSYSISHQLSATGTLVYNATGANDPLDVARTWCRDRSYVISTSGGLSSIAIDSLDFTGLINDLDSDSTNFWNKAVVESVGPTNYSWQLTESFIYNPDGNFREEFQAVVTYDADNPRRLTVNANGTIVGLADKSNDLDLRMTNAKSRYSVSVEPNLYTRVSSYVPVGYTINPVSTYKQITYDETAGSLRYSSTFAAVSGYLIANAVDETIGVTDTAPTDIFAQIVVPGRRNGPVVQYMNTSTLPERTVSISCTLAQNTSALSVGSLASLYIQKPNTNAIVDALKPSAGNFYVKQDSEEWNPIKRQYARTVSWTIQNEGASVTGIPSIVHKVQ